MKTLLCAHLVLVLVLSLGGCPNTEQPAEPVSSNDPVYHAPDATNVDAHGDDLYAVYRRGLITRHIAQNGRFLQQVVLQGIPENEYTKLSSQTGALSITVNHTAGATTYPVQNVRYSTERTSTDPKGERRVWVPLVAPVKQPGLANDTRWVLVGSGDNPNYYGGMALATFALEHKHGVSKYSLTYARKLVDYMLRSEIAGSNGYIARRGGFFATIPTMGGASAEELLGLMLGLMYYIEEEDDETYRTRAIALRDRVLNSIDRIPATTVNIKSPGDTWKYVHRYMSGEKYPVYQFKYPYFAARGDKRNGLPSTTYDTMLRYGGLQDRQECENAVADHIMPVVVLVGTPVAGAAVANLENYICGSGEDDFYDQATIFPMSLLLVTQSPYLTNRTKREWVGPAFEWLAATLRKDPTLTNNAFHAVLAKALTRVPGLSSHRYGDPARAAVYASGLDLIARATSCWEKDDANCWNHGDTENTPAPTYLWQHDLPLAKWHGGNPGNDAPSLAPVPTSFTATDYNPNDGIGSNWIWNRSSADYVAHYHQNDIDDPGTWAGWPDSAKTSASDVRPLVDNDYTALEYVRSHDKFYSSRGFREREIPGPDVQLETSGIDYLFLRMLLHEVDPTYEAPKLSDEMNLPYAVLPFDGPVKFASVSSLEATADVIVGGHKAEGGTNQRVDVAALPDGFVVTARPGTAGELRLDVWHAAPSFSVPLYASDQLAHVGRALFGDKFERVVLVPMGPGRVASVERAMESQFWGLANQYWLRVSYWSVGWDGIHRLSYRNGLKDNSAAQSIAAGATGDHTLAVGTVGREGERLLRIFTLNDSEVGTPRDTVRMQDESSADGSLEVTLAATRASADSGYLFYAIKSWVATGTNNNGTVYHQQFHFHALTSYADGTLGDSGQTEPLVADLLAATIVSEPPRDESLPIPRYLVAVAVDHNNSGSVDVHGWTIDGNGSLAYSGVFAGASADQYLLPKQLDWRAARIVSRESPDGPWFVVGGLGGPAGAGYVGRVQLLHGRILSNGRPTIEGLALLGDGKTPSGLGLANSPDYGVFSIHRNGEQSVATGSQVHLIRWQPKDENRCIESCDAVGADCGPLTQSGSYECEALADCGTCDSPSTCGGGGLDNVCGCTPSWDCTGKCGYISDGCASMADCGGCLDYQTCGTDNVCGGPGGAGSTPLYSWFQSDLWDQMDSPEGGESSSPWVFRGLIAFLPYDAGPENTTPLYRCVKDGADDVYDHMTTTSDVCENSSYQLEGPLGYVFNRPQPEVGTVALERCFDLQHNDHFVTLKVEGRDSCVGPNLAYDGVLGYVYPGCRSVDLMTDVNNCGGCEFSCGPHSSCSYGTCLCNSGYFNCNGRWDDGCESDPRLDDLNCGKCGSPCPESMVCNGGSCARPDSTGPGAGG